MITDPRTPRDAVDKGLSAFLLRGPLGGFVYLNWTDWVRQGARCAAGSVGGGWGKNRLPDATC